MALILALMVAALAAVVAVTLISGESRWLSSVEARRDYAQAKALTTAGIQWATHVLHEDKQQSNIDHLKESWAFQLPPTPIEYGSIEGFIVDLQGKINLNNLLPKSAYRKPERERLLALAALLNLEAAQLNPIFARFEPQPVTFSNTQGLLSQAQKKEVPSLYDVGDLLDAGLNPGVLKRLAPYLVALPTATTLNLNTAPREIIQASFPALSEEQITQLINARPFRNMTAFRRALRGNRTNTRGNTVGTDNSVALVSDYYLVTVKAQQGNARSEAQALIHRKDKNWPRQVWRVVE
jgi:general secretion pathway protein K